MDIVIQKFGGTSVATEQSRNEVAKKIIKAKEEGKKPVVVVSAMGRKGDPYATDTLIEFVSSINSSIPQRELDLLMSCGEIISAVVLTNILISKGYKASAMTGAQAGIITDDSFGNADVLMVNPKNIFELISKDIIPVIAGFQGISQTGNITTLGRGGSDTSASLIGEAVKANTIEIYTDVDGIMTADPRICPDAKVIEKISYNEVFQLADSGAKVIHPRAVEIAMRANIPLFIKNTFNERPGTCIIHYGGEENNLLKKSNNRLITGIAHRNNRLQICIEGENIDDEDLFSTLAENNISIDIINIFPERKLFTVDDKYKEIIIKILNQKNVKFKLTDNCCKITLIGERMTGVPGVMAKIIKCLNKNNITILQTVDSLTTIACLIHNSNTTKAVMALHKEFELGI
ncbi:aspartate kinase [Defluviitalea phaphyphila]|uniref:aspartate kinase n=1 Tax=Defluviitalea phaphyphila TaxID=1473580 RepID=UPI00073113EF|nr:aspartate kinase [Defluviitalea phaphyphila]